MFPKKKLGPVVVTGASTGIGEACALELAGGGVQVFAGIRRAEDGRRLKSRVEQLTPILLDVTDPASIAAAAATVSEATGESGLFGLVNNAGIVVVCPLEFLPLDELRRQFEVNVFGQLAVTQAFLPMLRRGGGRIINIGSISGKMSTPFLGPYSASKFALESLTDALRLELAAWKIPVSILEPGSIATPIWQKSGEAARQLAARLPPQAREHYGVSFALVEKAAEQAARRGISPQVVAETVRQALSAKKVRTRYLVGKDARIQSLLTRLLPDRLRDKMILRHLGMSGD